MCFRLVFSQSLLSLDIIEDFLHHIDEVNQNAEEGEKKEGEEGEKKDDKAKENGVAAGGSGEGASGSGEGASGSGDSAEKKTEKKEDKVKSSREFVPSCQQGSQRLEKYLNIQDCLEKSSKIKFTLKST